MNYRITLFASTILGLATANPALAQSRQVTTPNVTNAEAPVTVTLNGSSFVNQGIIGIGRLDANTRDFANETLGSFSGMAIDLKSWRRNADGTFTGSITTLPDRGPNDVGPFVGTTNYRNRVHFSTITLKPYTGTAMLPQAAASQNQLTIAPAGGVFLTDTTGVNFAGRDAAGNVITRGGVLYPQVASGEGTGRISLDSEAIAYLPDGSFYVSDEYAANIYYFDSTGRQIGALNTVKAILPTIGGVTNFNGGIAPDTGRRNNQGLEALAITPDNKRLVTILQSATMQDTSGSAQQTRNNTRILVYDISNGPIPSPNPIGEYVLQLPVFNQNGSGAAPDRTAAQSEMLALNNSQFLVLSRDGIGRGAAPTNSTTAIFKSVLLVDTTGATNLAGTPYETGTTPIATNGNLVSGIVPVQQVELVNMLNATQLNRFGMNLNTRPSTLTSLSEKWEAMGLAPVLEEAAPQDFFLFIGNDNDFITNNGFINGQTYDASLSGVGGNGNNDSVIIVYRLSLPTYVDPMALAVLNETSPGTLYLTRSALNSMGASMTQPAMRYLNAQRGFGSSGERPVGLWIDGGWDRVRDPAVAGRNIAMKGVTVGLDFQAASNLHVGAFGGYRKIDHSAIDLEAWTLGAYAGAELASGAYAQASVAWLGNARLGVSRGSAYGQTATGNSTGRGWVASGELGWMLGNEHLSYGSFVALDYSDIELDGYLEHGASVSNLGFADRSMRKLTGTLGGELATRVGSFRPAVRAGYSIEREYGDRSAVVRLASAQHLMGTVTLPLAETARDSAFSELRLAMRDGKLSGYLSAVGRWGRGDDDKRIALGIGYAF